MGILSTWWRTFQDKVRSSSFFSGYKVESQQTLIMTGKRPDYVGVSKENPQKRAVGDAKFVKELSFQHIKQVSDYRETVSAQKAAVFVPIKTKISEKVREKAHEVGVKIIRKKARNEKKVLAYT